MRILFLLVSLLLCSVSNATNYYFSSTNGDDSRTSAQAQNPATPWKTISKLNSIFASLNAGDHVLFYRGDVFYGSIAATKSGSSTNPINFGAYGTGGKPIITGFTTVSGWTNTGGNIWESNTAISTLGSCNVISVGGTNYAMGRLPKTGYWTIIGTNGNSITDGTNLNAGATNWAGAQVVLRKYRWILDRFTITAASGNTINFSNSGDGIQTGWGYFIQNDARACTQQNEWCYDPSAKKISIYSASTPANVKASSLDQGVNLNSYDYFSFENIFFQGYNTNGINTTHSAGVRIQNCDFSFMGVNGVYAYPNSPNLRVTGSTFTDCNSRGIHAGSTDNAYLSGNTLLNIGHFAGMGSNGDDSYTAIISNGDNAEVSYNSITNAGYCGIRWDGNAAVIKNNFVNTTNYIKDDGGGIYCYPNQLGPGPQSYTQRTVRDNIVLNSVGAIAGGTPSSGASEGMGIYNDGTSPNVDYINNTIANARLGLFLNGAHDTKSIGNTIYNCSRGFYLLNYQPSTGIANITVTDNIFVAKDANQYTAYYEPAGTIMPSTFIADNNVYARPIADNQTIWRDQNGTNIYNTLEQWKSYTGQEAGSTKSPAGITNINDLRFEYNETATAKTIALGASYIDLKGIIYSSSIVLAPYTSVVLLKTSAGNVLPVANAGTDQTISLPTATVSLSGSGTDPDGTITAYLWKKISGPVTGTITHTLSAATTVTALVQGIYQFELKVTDNNGATDTDTMQVTVNAASNIAPTSNAGPNQSISLPTITASLTGSGTDPDGTIASYSWRKVSGPAAGTITDITSAITMVTGLIQGIFEYELTVTDNHGATDTDTVTVMVGGLINQPPTANAGADRVITLPVYTASLSGSGNDPDGIIASYLWTKISGPASGTIANPVVAATTATGLGQGIYLYELRVTDNSGAVDTDTMQVTVNQGINSPYGGSPHPIPGTIQVEDFDNGGQNLAYYDNTPSNLGGVYRLTEFVDMEMSTEGTPNLGWTEAGEWMKYTVNVLSPGTYDLLARLSSQNTATSFRVEMDGITIATIPVPNTGGFQNWQTVTIPGIALSAGIRQMRIYIETGGFNFNYVSFTTAAAANHLPIANANIDQSITLPINTVSLIGSGTDPDGTITAYLWTKISGPAAGTITNVNSATTTATALVQGVYRFQLRVTDNSGATDTDTMQVTVNAALPPPNHLPIANANIDQSITLPVNTVSLIGSGTDPDGTITAYLWTKISGPAAGTITNANSATTTATALVQGVYRFQLTVTDNSGATDTDTMQVTVNAAPPPPNHLPIANANIDQSITLPVNTVSLIGSGTDPDGTITAYLWTKISGPAAGTITNANSATTTATALVQGVYRFQLTVTDNSGATDTDTMQVTVNAAAQVNQLPIANAGLDQNLTLPTNTATLTGSGTDPDGTITAYLWRKISGPAAGNITNTTSAITTATGLTQGLYRFELKVTDNSGATDTDTMQVTVNISVNQGPTANANIDQTITLPANTISLNGSGTDPDGIISTYLWRKVSGPAAGTIANTTSAATAVTGLVQGVYRFELNVTDNSGTSDTDTMQVTVNAAPPPPNQGPTANANIDQNITLPLNTVSLNGVGIDPDGTITAYRWTKIAGPAAGTIANANSANTTVTGLTQGLYSFQLRVTDNSGATDTDIMQVIVNAAALPTNQAPVAHAGADSSIYLPDNSIPLFGSGTDADGTIVGYNWVVLSGPSYVLTNSYNATANLYDLQQAVYLIELTVTDNNGATGKDTVQITVGAERLHTPVIDDVIILGNPVQSTLNAQIASSRINRQVTVTLYDMRGAKLIQKQIRIMQNVQVDQINMLVYKPGTYILQVDFDRENSIIRKLVKM